MGATRDGNGGGAGRVELAPHLLCPISISRCNTDYLMHTHT